jgi:ABC-type thiamin/hydroxymethylpyrimidine transport system permease subunit
MLDSFAHWILANPTEAVGFAGSILLPLLVWLVSKIPWFKVPEAAIRRWGATVIGAILAGLATEWLAPPFEVGKALSIMLATLGGATVLFRAVKWLIAQFTKPKE